MALSGKPLSGLLTACLLIFFVGLMVPIAWYLNHGWNFVAVMVLMLLFMITLGLGISGRPAGILVNEQNLMSLSRFQLVVWTVILLSAYLTMALERVHDNIPDAMGIALDRGDRRRDLRPSA